MAMSEAHKRASAKWQKNNMKRIPLDVRKEYYNDVLLPAVQKAGESVNGYIKKAIADRIEKEKAEENKMSFAAWLEKEYGIEFPYFDNNFSSSESDRIYGEYHEYLDA